MDFDAFEGVVKSCMDGNATGLDIGIEKGGCADASLSCLSKIVNTKNCTGDVLASMVSNRNWAEDNTGCNEGKLTSSGSDNCTVLAKANKAAIDDYKDDVVKKAEDSCTIPTTGSQGDKVRAKEACSSSIKTACPQPALNDNGTLKNDSDYTGYKNCLNNALKTTAKDGNECQGRGGIWVGQDYSDVSKGCKNNYSDLTNEPACKAGGGTWTKIDDASNPNHWECEPPSDKNNDNTDKNNNCDSSSQSTECTVDGANGNVGDPVEGSCGHRGKNPNDVIKTNLISCDTSGDAYQVLGDVLKIGVRVLTVLVGIAAVAGIVWESLQYARAQDDQSIVSHARDRIRDIVIGLFVYGFMIAIINWLVPGGVIQ